jgi:membrane-associated protease RseP (regulator of RpoE activity)
VFFHELGHFVTARMTGMKATQFFIGFGPRLFSFHRGETEYGVRLLPLGAFVRIIGMNNLDEVEPEDEGRTYRQKSYPRRMLVITAGSLMHLLLAAVLLFGVFATRGKLADRPGAEVGGIEADSGAEAAGIEPGDIILSVGGVEVDEGDLGAAVRSSDPGDTVLVVIERDGEERTLSATLGENTTPGDRFGTALLGVSSRGATEWRDQTLGEAAGSMVTDLFPATWESTKGIVQVLNPVSIFQHLSGESEDLSTRPTTVVGVTQFSDYVGDMEGLAGVLYLLAILNVFVGVFNMFPLLPLDGGHAAIATYERVREIGKGGGRYFTDVARLMPITMGVIVLLLFLFMSGLYLDIARPL